MLARFIRGSLVWKSFPKKKRPFSGARFLMEAPGRAKYVISLDQGTSSSRAILWTSACKPTISSQEKVTTTYPHPGWVEQDPEELWDVSIRCIQNLFEEAEKQGISLGPDNVSGIGITNQRETTIAWNKETGKPLHNAIIWLDTRTKDIVETMINEVGQNHYRPQTGLPLSPYFSGTKMKWLIDNCQEVKDAIAADVCLFGTVDSWLIWKLTGGPKGGVHVTDVTNASRTLLLNLKTLNYDDELLKAFSVPRKLLPEIKSSAEVYGKFNPSDNSHNAISKLNGVPITGCVGDQQAALLGQLCIEPGQAKCTYGTGCFLLYNTGTKPVESPSGLLTTVGYQLGPKEQPVYALEGSMAIAGAGLDWIKNLGFINHASEIDGLAGSVETTGGVYFIPAFSGLFAPHWKAEAKGIICGLTQATTKAHISLALLQSIAFGVVELMECAQQDSQLQIVQLNVDGGLTSSDLLLQTQSDFLGSSVEKPAEVETTSKGAALAAGIGSGLFTLKDIAEGPNDKHKIFAPNKNENFLAHLKELRDGWNQAVRATFTKC